MQNLKIKIAFLVILFLIVSFTFGLTAYAANENLQIVEESYLKYLIYVKDNLDNSFEFAFSDTQMMPEDSEFKDAGLDSETNGNYIAYLDEYSTASKYLWVKNSDGLVVDGIEVDLDEAIPKEELEFLPMITKIIEVDTTKTNVEEKEVDGNKVTVTTGKLVFLNEGTHLYQLFKVSDSEAYAEFMDLAERIAKFNDSTDMYTQIEVFKAFDLAGERVSQDVTSNWIEVEGNEILQPEDAKNGDKYILWLVEDDKMDIQFLTSKYVEEKVTEKITTKLPVTYDDNTLLYVLGGLVIAAIAVSIRINSLKKEEK